MRHVSVIVALLVLGIMSGSVYAQRSVLPGSSCSGNEGAPCVGDSRKQGICRSSRCDTGANTRAGGCLFGGVGACNPGYHCEGLNCVRDNH
jgi:hypothetical protein